MIVSTPCPSLIWLLEPSGCGDNIAKRSALEISLATDFYARAHAGSDMLGGGGGGWEIPVDRARGPTLEDHAVACRIAPGRAVGAILGAGRGHLQGLTRGSPWPAWEPYVSAAGLPLAGDLAILFGTPRAKKKKMFWIHQRKRIEKLNENQ